ncbi:TPA: hypothetical protein HGT28_08905 [Escherichia coli]|nr:hypothetical protein [Escherichia coli]
MDCVHHIWCPLFSQEFQDLPDGAETTLTGVQRYRNLHFIRCFAPAPFVTQRRDTGYPQSCLPE